MLPEFEFVSNRNRKIFQQPSEKPEFSFSSLAVFFVRFQKKDRSIIFWWWAIFSLLNPFFHPRIFVLKSKTFQTLSSSSLLSFSVSKISKIKQTLWRRKIFPKDSFPFSGPKKNDDDDDDGKEKVHFISEFFFLLLLLFVDWLNEWKLHHETLHIKLN